MASFEGKVKGMFCFLNRKQIYPLISFGLHCSIECDILSQYKSDPPTSAISSKIFTPNWFSLEPSHSTVVDPKLGDVRPRHYGAARALAESRCRT